MHVMIELPDDGGVLDWEVEASVDADGKLLTPPCVDSSEHSVFKITKKL
jgi:hypothetical protein